jgi:hypothetical protein
MAEDAPPSRRARRILILSLALIALFSVSGIWVLGGGSGWLEQAAPNELICIRSEARERNILTRRPDQRTWDVSLPGAVRLGSMTLDCVIEEGSMTHEIMSQNYAYCLGRHPFGAGCRVVRLSKPLLKLPEALGWAVDFDWHYNLGKLDWIPGSEGDGVLTTSELAAQQIRTGQWFHLGGFVVKGSIKVDDVSLPRFAVTDRRTELVVHFERNLPETVAEQACILLEGTVWDNRALIAHEASRVFQTDALSLPVDKQPCKWAK